MAERILFICKKPVCFEGILQEVFKGYGLAMNFEQYVLVGSTNSAIELYISELEKYSGYAEWVDVCKGY